MTPRERIIARYGLGKPELVAPTLAKISNDYRAASADFLRLSARAEKLAKAIQSRLDTAKPPTKAQLQAATELAILFGKGVECNFDFGEMPAHHDALWMMAAFLSGEMAVAENGDFVRPQAAP